MELRSPSPQEHYESLCDLYGRTFSDYWERCAYATDGYLADSPYDWKASRIGLVDGEIATHFGVWDFAMRIGAGEVRVAGVGAVATAKPHRKKGLMARTAGECVDGLFDAGYDLSLLFGIPNFYHTYGYVGCFPQIRTELQTRNVPASDRQVHYERYEGPVTELASLYNAENEGVTGTYVRPTYRRNRRPDRFTIYRFTDGYVVCGRVDEAFQVADCVGDPETILEIVRRLAAAELCSEISFVFLPPRSRMGEYLRTRTHRITSDRHRNGGPMMKIVNLGATFEKIRPTLDSRLEASPLHSYSGTLALYGDGDAVVLGIMGGELTEITHADAATTANGSVVAGAPLARLLMGDGDPQRVCRESRIELDGDAKHLVPILFPDQEPSTILWDRV